MIDFTKLTPGELDELIAANLLEIIHRLSEANVPREQFRDELNDINGAVSELVDRTSEQGSRDSYQHVAGTLQATLLDLRTLAARLEVALTGRGEEENAD